MVAVAAAVVVDVHDGGVGVGRDADVVRNVDVVRDDEVVHGADVVHDVLDDEVHDADNVVHDADDHDVGHVPAVDDEKMEDLHHDSVVNVVVINVHHDVHHNVDVVADAAVVDPPCYD